MAPNVEFHTEAADEVLAAFQWYSSRNTPAGTAFIRELDNAVSNIAKSPERWPKYVHGTRRYLFRRFPYFLVYRISGLTLQVVAVAHGRRRPAYWKNRAE